MSRLNSQCKKVLEYMREHGSISQLEALREFGCMRLASRISDLKAAGYDISREFEPFTARDGTKGHYARYRLKE